MAVLPFFDVLSTLKKGHWNFQFTQLGLPNRMYRPWIVWRAMNWDTCRICSQQLFCYRQRNRGLRKKNFWWNAKPVFEHIFQVLHSATRVKERRLCQSPWRRRSQVGRLNTPTHKRTRMNKISKLFVSLMSCVTFNTSLLGPQVTWPPLISSTPALFSHRAASLVNSQNAAWWRTGRGNVMRISLADKLATFMWSVMIAYICIFCLALCKHSSCSCGLFKKSNCPPPHLKTNSM